MALTDNEKGEIITYVKETFEGNSTCDDEDNEMVVFTFDKGEDQPSLGTESTLELLKRGYFILYALVNEDGKFELSITNGAGYKDE